MNNNIMIYVGLICIIDRSVPMEEETQVFDFLMANVESFVGIDVANEEAFPCKRFSSWFQQARAAGLGLTCHAGMSTHNIAKTDYFIHRVCFGQVNRL